MVNIIPQIHKALELYTQLRQRMGVVIVGPSGSGKTTVWTLLKKALNKTGSTVKHCVMNPKAMPRTQVSYICKHTCASVGTIRVYQLSLNTESM